MAPCLRVKLVPFTPVTASLRVARTVVRAVAVPIPTPVESADGVCNVTFGAVVSLPGAGAAVPLRATECGLPVALSATLSDAVRAPATVGLKVTSMAQEDPAARLAPQVGWVWAKSPAFAPPMAMLVSVRPAVPVLVRVTLWAGAALPTGVLANVRLGALKLAIGAGGTVLIVNAYVSGVPVLPAASVALTLNTHLLLDLAG